MKLIHTICLSLALSFGSITTAQAQSGYFLHTVTKGQSLYSISTMYNVTMEDLIRLNPGCEKQIRAGESLKIPQADSGSNQGKPTFHTIQAGETLYQLTLKYNVTVQAICTANPGLSASNFRIGQVISIPAQTAIQPAKENLSETAAQTSSGKKTDWRDMHKVERKETIFSISRQYGISEEELIAANPELKKGKLKRGSFLFIPYPASKQPVKEAEKTPARIPSNEELFAQNKQSLKKIQNIKAAVLLPFTEGKNRDEQMRMVEYYEGFLMAVDSLKRQGVSVNLYTYDTKGKSDVTQSILAKEEMKNMDIIFGPAHAANVKTLAEFAEKNQTRVVVPFSPEVEQVFKNPYIYQVNTPQSYLYSEVYEHFLRKFSKANIVFLDAGTGQNEKAEFIKGMKNELKTNQVAYKHISNSDTLKILAAIDSTRENIFIPTSGKDLSLTRLIPQLTQIRRSYPNVDLHLFGYPEWQTYTQDYLASFYELDTYFYSSFYTNNLFPAAVRFTQEYRRWYSKDMANIFPKYGMLGFDTGYFFLKGLAQEGSQLENNLNRVQVTPIQTGFKFERVNNWGGFINRKVFFVHLTKDFELIKLDFE
ncbi:MAG: LysM peptidoglycan-binding domain-containing protein [Bacteroides sp.]|nr:LysM peptidoglycan-binding domain-containing protein [Bacteroides sp.]